MPPARVSKAPARLQPLRNGELDVDPDADKVATQRGTHLLHVPSYRVIESGIWLYESLELRESRLRA